MSRHVSKCLTQNFDHQVNVVITSLLLFLQTAMYSISQDDSNGVFWLLFVISEGESLRIKMT